MKPRLLGLIVAMSIFPLTVSASNATAKAASTTLSCLHALLGINGKAETSSKDEGSFTIHHLRERAATGVAELENPNAATAVFTLNGYTGWAPESLTKFSQARFFSVKANSKGAASRSPLKTGTIPLDSSLKSALPQIEQLADLQTDLENLQPDMMSTAVPVAMLAKLMAGHSLAPFYEGTWQINENSNWVSVPNWILSEILYLQGQEALAGSDEDFWEKQYSKIVSWGQRTLKIIKQSRISLTKLYSNESDFAGINLPTYLNGTSQLLADARKEVAFQVGPSHFSLQQRLYKDLARYIPGPVWYQQPSLLENGSSRKISIDLTKRVISPSDVADYDPERFEMDNLAAHIALQTTSAAALRIGVDPGVIIDEALTVFNKHATASNGTERPLLGVVGEVLFESNKQDLYWLSGSNKVANWMAQSIYDLMDATSVLLIGNVLLAQLESKSAIQLKAEFKKACEHLGLITPESLSQPIDLMIDQLKENQFSDDRLSQTMALRGFLRLIEARTFKVKGHETLLKAHLLAFVANNIWNYHHHTMTYQLSAVRAANTSAKQFIEGSGYLDTDRAMVLRFIFEKTGDSVQPESDPISGAKAANQRKSAWQRYYQLFEPTREALGRPNGSTPRHIEEDPNEITEAEVSPERKAWIRRLIGQVVALFDQSLKKDEE